MDSALLNIELARFHFLSQIEAIAEVLLRAIVGQAIHDIQELLFV